MVNRLINYDRELSMDLTRLGAALRERREALGIPRTEIARRVDVTPTYVWLIETAKTRSGGEPSRPTRSVLERWSVALGMDERYTKQVLALAAYGSEGATSPSHMPMDVESAGEALSSPLSEPEPNPRTEHQGTGDCRNSPVGAGTDTPGSLNFASAPITFRQPRDLQTGVLLDEVRMVLELAQRSDKQWTDTTQLLEGYLDWLHFRLTPGGPHLSRSGKEDSTPLLPMFARRLWVFSRDEPLTHALGYMRRENFSQVVVSNNGALALLTVEGIARFVEDRAEEDQIDLAGTTVGEVLAHDDPASYALMGSTNTLADAHAAFAGRDRGGRLYAIILTDTGTSTDEPIGIVTPWDIAAGRTNPTTGRSSPGPRQYVQTQPADQRNV